MVLRALRSLLRGGTFYPDLSVPAKVVDKKERKKKIVVPDGANNRQLLLFQELAGFPFVWVYLHGSQGDRTANAFSDYDDLIIIDIEKMDKTEVKKLVKSLNRVQMRFCRLDPLQHHGHWIITKQSLNDYDESYMPLLVLQEGVVIQGPHEIRYTSNESATRTGLRTNIYNTCEAISSLYNIYEKGIIGSYKLKGLVGSFALMPAFIFQYRGEPLTKVEAIERAKEIFSDKAYACIVWASYCRENWEVVTCDIRHRGLKLLSYIIFNPHLYRSLAQVLSPNVRLKKVKFNFLDKESVDAFIEESERVLRNETC
jgi:hypothetical protein